MRPTLLALLLALLAPDARAASLDELTRGLDTLSQDVAALRPGDTATARRLMLKVNQLRSGLGSVADRAQPGWQAQVDRSAALATRIKEVAAQAAPGSAGGRALGSVDRHYFEEYEKAHQRHLARLESLDATRTVDRSSRLETAAQEMRRALDRVGDQQHPSVVEARQQIDAFEQAYAQKMAAGKTELAAQAQARAEEDQEVGAQLDQLAKMFDQDAFDCALKPPYTPGRMREWIADLKGYDLQQRKGVTHLEALVKDHPRFQNDERVQKLTVWFSRWLPLELHEGIGLTATSVDHGAGVQLGALPARVAEAKRLMGLAKADVGLRLKALREGVEAAEALSIFAAEYEGKPRPELKADAQAFSAAMERAAAGAKAALAATRMPVAKSQDPALKELAEKTLEKAGYKGWLRLVINWDLHHFNEMAQETREVGDRLVITTFPKEWDQFQVTVAERHGEAVNLVAYDLKKYVRAGPGAPIGRWFVSERIVSGRILAENVDK